MKIFQDNIKGLDDIKFAFLLLMTLSLPFSESIKTLGLLGGLFIFLVQIIRREAHIRVSGLHYGFVIFFISSAVSSIFAATPSRSLSGSKDVLFYTITFFIASSLGERKKIKTLLWGLYISTALSAVLGIFNSIIAHRPLEIHSLGNQNYTAMFFMIVTISMISTVLYSDQETFRKKLFLIILSSIILWASAMTLMRSSFLGLFAFFISLLLLNPRKLSRTVLLCLGGFVFLTVLVLYLDRAMWQKLFSFQSMVSRIDIWSGAIKVFLENPITGVGLNHFEFRFPPDHPVEPNNTVYDAHSLYLQVASEMGLIGLLSLIILLYGFIKAVVGPRDLSGYGESLRWGALGAFFVIAIAGVLDTTLHHEQAMAFSLISGLYFGYIKRQGNGL